MSSSRTKEEEHVSSTELGTVKTVSWKLENWRGRKEIHVGGSTCDVTLIAPDEGIARVRYGLMWKSNYGVVDSGITMGQWGAGSECISKYLGLTVEPLQWPGPESLLHVSLSLKQNLDRLQVMNPMTQPNTHFHTCVRLDINGDGKGKQITLFDMIPDTTRNQRYPSVDLILDISSCIAESKTTIQ